VRQARHYARRTMATYEQWLRRFLRFHHRRHPREMGSEEVNAFLTHLAVDLQVSASTQNLEALRLRVQDLDFERRELTVRDGKGGKDRRTLLPQSQCEPLKEHLLHVRRLHQQDLAAGWGAVILRGWQWVFPQRNRWQDSATRP
jgi:integrase